MPAQSDLAAFKPSILSRHARAIVWFPFIFVAVLWIPALFPTNGYRIFSLLAHENGPIELPTALLALLAAWMSVRHALLLRRDGKPSWIWAFYILFGVGMFLAGMEEIAWGQQILRFPTPAFWAEINAQHETTLHNLGPLQGHSEYFRLVFCLGAVVGLLAGRFRVFALVAVPPLLWSWLLLMTGITLVDTLNDFYPIEPYFDRYVNKFSEVIELMIAMVGCLYVRLNYEAYLAEKGGMRAEG
jgi:hypothetical protein